MFQPKQASPDDKPADPRRLRTMYPRANCASSETQAEKENSGKSIGSAKPPMIFGEVKVSKLRRSSTPPPLDSKYLEDWRGKHKLRSAVVATCRVLRHKLLGVQGQQAYQCKEFF
eukprot:2066759-Rhodomonas_salina.1